MAKAPVVEDAQMRHAFKVAGVSGQTPVRDIALLHVLYGTGMTATEVAQLEVADVLDERGEFRRQSEVRAAISFNGRARPVFWVNTKACAALDAYFAERLKLGQGVTAWRSQWRGLVQLGPVFLTSRLGLRTDQEAPEAGWWRGRRLLGLRCAASARHNAIPGGGPARLHQSHRPPDVRNAPGGAGPRPRSRAAAARPRRSWTTPIPMLSRRRQPLKKCSRQRYDGCQ